MNKDVTTWASKLKEDGQAYFFVIKLHNMYGRYWKIKHRTIEHKNTLHPTQEFLQLTLGGNSHISEA